MPLGCYMVIPSLRVEWSFCKCTNASFPPLLSSLTGFDKLICVCVCVCLCVRVYTLFCLTHCANTPVWPSSYHRNEKIFIYTPPTFPPYSILVRIQSISDHPRPGHLVSTNMCSRSISFQTGCSVVVCGRASQHGLLIFLLTLVCEISLNWRDVIVVMVTPGI